MERKVFIEPVARVEGHGGIEVFVEGNKVKEVKVDIFEGPRLMEELVKGKYPEEAVSITSRICAICFLSHRLSDIRAHERALWVEPSEKTKLLRKLAHYGEMIESHSLHYYLLALPDYLGYPDAISMMKAFPREVKGALELKKYGNRVMEIIAGRRVHGENMKVGGFGSLPGEEDLHWIAEMARNLIPEIERGLAVWGKLDIPDYMEADTTFASVWPEDGEFGFTADTIKISDGTELPADEYKALTNEYVVPHSFAKRCRYKGKPYTVGALARVLLMSERLDGQAKKWFKKYYNQRWWKNPHYNNVAQAIELLFCLEKIPALVEAIKKADYYEASPSRDSGSGTGIVEAPRGLLIHHYEIEGGRVKEADFVIPTTQNLDDIEKYIRIAAQNLLDKGEQEIELPLEMIMRAYDPCISCSVHMVRVVRRT